MLVLTVRNQPLIISVTRCRRGSTITRSTLVGVALVSIAEIEARHAKRKGSSTERTGGVEVEVPIRMNGVDVGRLTGRFTLTSRALDTRGKQGRGSESGSHGDGGGRTMPPSKEDRLRMRRLKRCAFCFFFIFFVFFYELRCIFFVWTGTAVTDTCY